MTQNVNPIAAVRSLASVEDCVAILNALERLGAHDGPFTTARLAELFAAEAHFNRLLAREAGRYFAALADPLQKAGNAAFAKHVQLSHAHFASAFHRFAVNHKTWASASERETVQRTTALAVSSYGALVKWSYFLHETLKGVSWAELNSLYYFAEKQRFHRGILMPREDDDFPTSIEMLYLRALMMDAINPGSLSPAQIEIAEHWLTEWCGEYTLDMSYAPRSHWLCVDLDEQSGLRIIAPDVFRESIRYLRADTLRNQIEDVKNELRSGRRFAGRGEAIEFPIENYATLLSAVEKLYQAILVRSGTRVEERSIVENLQAEVIIGLDAAFRVIGAGTAPAADARRSLDEIPHHWKVHDVSSTGLGLLIDRDTGDLVPLQHLVAVRVAGAEHWALGSIVRKLTNRVRGQTLVGVEVLSYRPIPVLLRRASTRPEEGATSAGALYVPAIEGTGRHDLLVIRESRFDPRNPFEIVVRHAHYRVRFNRAVKKGADWIALRFDVENRR